MGKSAPKAPDPKQTAAAQTGTNVATAQANAILGNINEYTPDGSTTFSRGETQDVFDPSTGKTYKIPQYTRTTTLSPEQQAIKAQQDRASLNLSTLGGDLSGTLGNQLTGNFSLGNEETEKRLFDLGRKRLDPKIAEGRSSLEARLADQGIKQGSAAYDRATRNYGEQENDAYNQLLLTGRGQASQELLTEDNQRINQISALLNGGQVSQPSFMGGNMPNIPTTDYAGLVQQNYANKMGQYQQGQANLGGLFSGLGSMFALSDRRAKTDIEEVGKVKGHKVYEYRYKGDTGPKHIGLMAQEVAKKKPEAVVTGDDGFMRVNYRSALSLGA